MKHLALWLACAAVAAAQTPQPKVRSEIVLTDIDGKQQKVIYQARRRFEAPNWSRDGRLASPCRSETRTRWWMRSYD